MKKMNVYIDTSVIGGCFDLAFAFESRLFFREVKKHGLHMHFADVVLEELHDAPPPVRELFANLPHDLLHRIELTDDIFALRDIYLKAGIVGKKWISDATHVAAATVNRLDAIVSWNFRHIVKLDKMKAYNQANLAHGYGIITIVSPREVLGEYRHSH